MFVRVPMQNAGCRENSPHGGRLQRRHTFEEQIVVACNLACGLHDNCERMWTASAEEARIASRCFDHIQFPCQRIEASQHFPDENSASRQSLYARDE
jgi:hypothetical protein